MKTEIGKVSRYVLPGRVVSKEGGRYQLAHPVVGSPMPVGICLWKTGWEAEICTSGDVRVPGAYFVVGETLYLNNHGVLLPSLPKTGIAQKIGVAIDEDTVRLDIQPPIKIPTTNPLRQIKFEEQTIALKKMDLDTPDQGTIISTEPEFDWDWTS